jgi:acyl carrier protein
MEAEKKFDIPIPDEQAEKINTVGELIGFIREHKQKR